MKRIVCIRESWNKSIGPCPIKGEIVEFLKIADDPDFIVLNARYQFTYGGQEHCFRATHFRPLNPLEAVTEDDIAAALNWLEHIMPGTETLHPQEK